MTLRTVRHLGYGIPDLAWLKLREIEYYFDDEDSGESTLTESEAAFSF
jgi:hypothetical protein